jgi:hypothetical protein
MFLLTYTSLSLEVLILHNYPLYISIIYFGIIQLFPTTFTASAILNPIQVALENGPRCPLSGDFGGYMHHCRIWCNCQLVPFVTHLGWQNDDTHKAFYCIPVIRTYCKMAAHKEGALSHLVLHCEASSWRPQVCSITKLVLID